MGPNPPRKSCVCATSRRIPSSAGPRSGFTLVGENQKLNVIYTGTEPLPDTFRDGAQALAEGKMGPRWRLHAAKIQPSALRSTAPKPGELYKPGEKRATPQKISSTSKACNRMENLGSLAVLLAFCLAVYAVIGSVVGGSNATPS